jgi:thymidylate kinase
MIIVEGPDGAGKTTLIKQLVNHYGMKVGKRGTDNRDLLYTVTVPDTFRALRLALEGGNGLPTIWDRLYFSDLVYAPIQGREVAFSREERYFIEQTIIALDIPVILCVPPWKTVMENEAGTHQMEGVHENLRRIYNAYSSGFAVRVPTYTYDYTSSKFEDLTAQIDRYLRRKKARKWYPPHGGNN